MIRTLRNILCISLVISIAMAGASALLPAEAAAQNLIANASFETAANTTTPQDWTTNSWGTNAAGFSYQNTAHTGTRSVKTQLTSWTDGDAKWYFKPVAVTPGQTYTYSDYYQANVAAQITVRYTHTDGTFSYEWIGSAAANANWAQASYNFDIPAGVQEVTVFHLLASVGWLAMDDASLAVADPPQPPLPGANLVGNPSLEISGNGTTPDDWQTGTWGVNSALFTYPPEGHTGGKSVKAELSSWTSGDAKWYFKPVAVAPQTEYTFSDYVKANVATQAIARYTHADGSFSYEVLGQIPASSSTWHQTQFSLTTPSTARTVTVFHIIASVGWLMLDDASVTLAAPQGIQLPNASLETPMPGNPNLPDQWHTDAWGNNTVNFEYATTGHTGSRSVKMTMSNYTDGDAKWYFTPQQLSPGKTYRFSAWYKGTAQPHPAVLYTKSGGAEDYLGIPDPDPISDPDQWQRFSDTFTVPLDAVNVSLFFKIAGNGWLQTDDYTLEDYKPVGFTRPLVTLTFDDGHEENVSTVIPVLNSHNFKSTQCFISQAIEGNQAGTANVRAFQNAGHEICSHTVSHPFLTQLTPAQVDYELSHAKSVLENVTGGPIRNFASPYGDYNPSVLAQIRQYYRSHRTVDPGYNSKDNFNIYKLRVQNMQDTTTLAEYQSWLDQAKASKTWLVLVYHRVTTGTPGPYDTRASDFGQQMQALQASGLIVRTYNEALDEVAGQL